MRRRLILVALAISTMVAVAFLVPLGLSIGRFQKNIELVKAAQDAREVTSATYLLYSDQPDVADKDVSRFINYAQGAGYTSSDYEIVVWLPTGRSISVSPLNPPTAPTAPPESVETMVRSKVAFNDRNPVPGGYELLWSTQAPEGEGNVVVRVFVADHLLTKGVAFNWFTFTLVALALILAAVAIADRLARSIVKPTKELADVTRRLSAGESDARTTPSGPPEIADVGGAVNNLADRIDELLAAERETLADLSHRLRTPLAALRLDADALSGTEIGERISADIAAMEQAVSNVIREVRAPKRASDISCDLIDVARLRCEFWQVLAEDDGREWRVDLPHGAAWVPLKRDDLATALDALVTNAFTYTPEGTAIRVFVVVGTNEATLTIDDNGPGFPDNFQIRRGESGGTSTGLGLDIAQRTARAVGGRLSLANRAEGGARVQLAFPLRVSPTAPKRGGRNRNPNGSGGSTANGRPTTPVNAA